MWAREGRPASTAMDFPAMRDDPIRAATTAHVVIASLPVPLPMPAPDDQLYGRNTGFAAGPTSRPATDRCSMARR